MQNDKPIHFTITDQPIREYVNVVAVYGALSNGGLSLPPKDYFVELSALSNQKGSRPGIRMNNDTSTSVRTMRQDRTRLNEKVREDSKRRNQRYAGDLFNRPG